MDTLTKATLSRVHSNLFNDLNEIGSYLEHKGNDAIRNDVVRSDVMRALNHLRDLEPLIDPEPNTEFRKAQIEGGYSDIDVIDLLMNKLEGAEAICDMLAVIAGADQDSDLCGETLHRAAFTARNLVTECLEKTKTWNAQHSSRGAS